MLEFIDLANPSDCSQNFLLINIAKDKQKFKSDVQISRLRCKTHCTNCLKSSDRTCQTFCTLSEKKMQDHIFSWQYCYLPISGKGTKQKQKTIMLLYFFQLKHVLEININFFKCLLDACFSYSQKVHSARMHQNRKTCIETQDPCCLSSLYIQLTSKNASQNAVLCSAVNTCHELLGVFL